MVTGYCENYGYAVDGVTVAPQDRERRVQRCETVLTVASRSKSPAGLGETQLVYAPPEQREAFKDSQGTEPRFQETAPTSPLTTVIAAAILHRQKRLWLVLGALAEV